MRRVSMATRDELVNAVRERYARSGRAEKSRILDEFVAVSGFHRKHAMRLLRTGPHIRGSGPRPERRLYDDAVREALIVIWEASDRICGKRLKALVPILVEAMERHGHLHLAPEIRTRLLTMSAATIDRALKGVRETAGGRKRRRTVASTALRRRAFRSALSPTGRILRPVLWRPTWWRTAARSRAAVSCRRSCSPTLRPDGRNARLCWSASRNC